MREAPPGFLPHILWLCGNMKTGHPLTGLAVCDVCPLGLQCLILDPKGSGQCRFASLGFSANLAFGASIPLNAHLDLPLNEDPRERRTEVGILGRGVGWYSPCVGVEGRGSGGG